MERRDYFLSIVAWIFLMLSGTTVNSQGTSSSHNQMCRCQFDLRTLPSDDALMTTSSRDTDVTNQMTSLKHDVTEMRTQISALMTHNAAKDAQIAALMTQLTAMSQVTSSLLAKIDESRDRHLDGQVDDHKDVSNRTGQGVGGGVTYVRWGRTRCPQGADVVYKGVMGGSSVHDPGSGSNYLCLPDEPVWSNYTSTLEPSGSKIYGVEYELGPNSGSPFSTANSEGRSLLNHDAPCVVCHVTSRTAHLMIPASNRCDVAAGWHKEYDGYLVSDHQSHKRSEFICLDSAPETTRGGQDDRNGAMLYPVQAVCGSLPCPKYVNGYELACVVCTK